MLRFRLTYTSRFGPGRAEIIVFFSLPFFEFVYISSFCFIVHSLNIGKPSHSHTYTINSSPHVAGTGGGGGERGATHLQGERGWGKSREAIVPAFPSRPHRGPLSYILFLFLRLYRFFYVRQVFRSGFFFLEK